MGKRTNNEFIHLEDQTPDQLKKLIRSLTSYEEEILSDIEYSGEDTREDLPLLRGLLHFLKEEYLGGELDDEEDEMESPWDSYAEEDEEEEDEEY